MTATPLLEVDDLSITYHTDGDDVRAVTDASFTIESGEYYGLVGESGSGKSTIAKALIGGLDANAEIVSGTIRFRGREIESFGEAEFNEHIRWKEVSFIPQASMDSLDPIVTIRDQALELARAHTDWDTEETVRRLGTLFDVVGLPASRIDDYPYEFSGGMEQRALIALALLLDPSLVVADEPTTALDVIMQDQILQYMEEIRAEEDLSMLLITHDISVVFETCDTMAVLHGGQVAESGPATALFDRPTHPYTHLLQRAFPDIRSPDRELRTIGGEPPRLRGDVSHCTFADRCPWSAPECRADAPPLETVDGALTHSSSCIRRQDIDELNGGRRAADHPPEQDSVPEEAHR
jgi:oligopeptide/dipeptide ABC transporter ATP-binding protein